MLCFLCTLLFAVEDRQGLEVGGRDHWRSLSPSTPGHTRWEVERKREWKGEKERHTAVECFTGRREGPAGTSHYLKVILFHTTKTQWHVKVCPNQSAGPHLMVKRSKQQSGTQKRITWCQYYCVDHHFCIFFYKNVPIFSTKWQTNSNIMHLSTVARSNVQCKL